GGRDREARGRAAGRAGAEAAHGLHGRSARGHRSRAVALPRRLPRARLFQARSRPAPGFADGRDALPALRPAPPRPRPPGGAGAPGGEGRGVGEAGAGLGGVAKVEVKRVVRKWGGLRSFVADKTPVVGPAPEAPGFIWLAGQGGFGIMPSPAMGRLATAMATGDAFPAELTRLGVRPDQLLPGRFPD